MAVGGVEEEVVLAAGTEALTLPGAGLSRSPWPPAWGRLPKLRAILFTHTPQWELVM